ncbi:fatty acyl-AMP ligase [Mycobacterium sp. WMMD1722]|uniref:fatty acyl-AMP ligase n=1 Tax=Mycobacterium sp. WMMD1722 TaxID=3404117 RepID=UPI003BF5FB77
MSTFTERMFANAVSSANGMTTGEPHLPERRTWSEVHHRASCLAGGLRDVGVGRGDVVAVLAGAPAEIAPTAQGVWMRGACLTMLHQPTPRSDLQLWAAETAGVVSLIGAKAVILSDPFMAAEPVLRSLGIPVVTVDELLAADPVAAVDTDDDDVALMQLTSGSTGSPKAVHITHANIVANAEAMFRAADYRLDTDVIVSWLPLFHDMGMTGFLTVPMYFGAELVKVTPMDFLGDILLWPRLIDKYRGTMTAAPNFAWALLAKRLRRQAVPGEFDLSTLRFALSGAEQVDPAAVEDLCEAGEPFGLNPRAVLPAYGMAETTVAVSFSRLGAGLAVDEVDADLLSSLDRAVPSTSGRTRRLTCLGVPLDDMRARVVNDDADVLAPRAIGVIQVQGSSLTPGYTTMAGFRPAADESGWYDTGDLGYLTEDGRIVVCGRVKEVIIMAGRNIYPADVERAAARVHGVRPGCVVAVRLDAGHPRETFAVVVEAGEWNVHGEVRRIEHEVAHAVVSEVDMRPRKVSVVAPGTIPKTPSGKPRRALASGLVP